MKRLVVLALVVTALGACSRKKKQEEPETPDNAVRPGTTLGSETGSAGSAGSAGTSMSAPPAADPAQRIADCWGFRSEGKWDELKTCYAPDATLELVGSGIPPFHGADAIVDAAKGVRATFPDERGEPFVTLIDKQHATVLLVHTGTNSGTDPTGKLKANGKKFGDIVGQSIDLDDQGRMRQIQEYFDLATSSGQLQPAKDHPVRAVMDKAPIEKVVATAHGDDKEKANVAIAEKLTAALAAHDEKSAAELVADDAVWFDPTLVKDETKQELAASLPKLWKAFPDATTSVVSRMAAGDFVATISSVKPDKTSPALSGLVVSQIRDGKVVRSWTLFQRLPPATKK